MKVDAAMIWEFVSDNYPNYTTCDEILKADILTRIVDGEYEEDMDDSAWEMIVRDYEGDPSNDKILVDKELQDGYCYERAIEGFIAKQSKQSDYVKDVSVTAQMLLSFNDGDNALPVLDKMHDLAVKFIEKYPTDTNWEDTEDSWEDTLYNFFVEGTATHSTLYPRRCDITGLGMNSGWYDESSEEVSYIRNQSDVVKHIRGIMAQDEQFKGEADTATDDRVLNVGYAFYGIYYTEWEELDENENYTFNGTKITRDEQ